MEIHFNCLIYETTSTHPTLFFFFESKKFNFTRYRTLLDGILTIECNGIVIFIWYCPFLSGHMKCGVENLPKPSPNGVLAPIRRQKLGIGKSNSLLQSLMFIGHRLNRHERAILLPSNSETSAYPWALKTFFIMLAFLILNMMAYDGSCGLHWSSFSRTYSRSFCKIFESKKGEESIADTYPIITRSKCKEGTNSKDFKRRN